MTTEQDWEPCPPGTIKKVTDRQQEATRNATMSRRAVVVSAISAGSLFLWTQQPAQPALTCRQVCDHGVKYVQGKLAPELAAAVATHCRECRRCDKHIARLRRTTTA